MEKGKEQKKCQPSLDFWMVLSVFMFSDSFNYFGMSTEARCTAFASVSTDENRDYIGLFS